MFQKSKCLQNLNLISAIPPWASYTELRNSKIYTKKTFIIKLVDIFKNKEKIPKNLAGK